jgi:hypothetical protein
MSPEAFRRIALAMNGVVEGAHMGHPDFRLHGKIFATLHPDQQWGMVKLTPEQQQRFVRDAPATFTPEKGAWGLRGYTAVRLAAADEDVLGEAMTLAWQNVSRKREATRPKARPRTGSL